MKRNKRKKSKATFSIRSGLSNRRKSTRAITYDNRTYERDVFYPSVSSRRNEIPVDRDSVMNRSEFLPSISSKIDKRGNFAWID